MKSVRITYDQIPEFEPMSAAIGYFDGLHLGHQQLISEAEKEAEKKNLKSALITFDPDPWAVFRPDANRDHLQTMKQKEQMARALGLDEMIVIDFSKEFAALSPDEFHRMLKSMNVQHLVCGFDFSYGFHGSGNPETLKNQTDFEVEVIDSVNDEKEKISSSRIEALVRNGEVQKAGELLGSLYCIEGEVVHGFKRGSRLLGFPTANLKCESGLVIPEKGVYAGLAEVDGRLYEAMINIGKNPTFQNDDMSIEAHLLNFEGDLYGKEVRFFFAKRIRPEIRFENPDQLKKQLAEDESQVGPLLSEMTPLIERTAALWRLSPDFDIIRK